MSLLSQIGDITSVPSLGLARQVGQLFFPREYRLLSSDKTVEIKIDTVMNERHESALTISKYAVEQGADMSDHFIVNPTVFNLTGVISDISSNEIIDYALTGAAKKAFTGATGLFDENSDGNEEEESGTRSQLAWKELVSLQQSGLFVDFNSQLALYKNMMITRLSVSQDNSTSNAIFFDMTLEQVLIAELEVVKGKGIFKSADPSKGKADTPARNADVVQKGKKAGVTQAPQTGLARAADFFL